MNDQLRIPAPRDLPAGWLQRYKEYLVREVTSEPAFGRRRRRRLALVLLPAIVALLAATAFTTYALTREPTHLESIGCFDSANLGANTTVVDADGRDPVVICAELWQHGVVAGDAPAPKQLAACVLESGAIGVFPSSSADTCAQLGLATLPASYAAEGKRFAELRDAIVSQLGEPASGSSRGSSKCVHEASARALIRRELDARGYGDWRIEVAGDGFTAERPCAEVGFDGKQKIVLLVPVWR